MDDWPEKLDALYRDGVEQAVQNPEEADWARLYRIGAMRALHRIPRKGLPQDLLVVGIMANALELVGWSLYISNGRNGPIYFAGDGVLALFSWLNGCRTLFERLEQVAPDLAPGRDGPLIIPKVVAMRVECNRLFSELFDAVADEEPGSNETDILAVPVGTVAEITKNLIVIATEWLSQRSVCILIEGIGQCNRELYQFRALTKDPDAKKDS